MVFFVRRFTPPVEMQLRELAKIEDVSGMMPLMEAPGAFLGFHKFSVVLGADNDHKQTATHALCMLDHSIAQLKAKLPWARKMILQFDGGSSYHAAQFILGSWMIARAHHIHLERLLHNASGHGKDHADHLFGSSKGGNNILINAGVDIISALHFAVGGHAGAPSTVYSDTCSLCAYLSAKHGRVPKAMAAYM